MTETAEGRPNAMPEATVLICTRNRPADLLRAVCSILASSGVDLELIVMDQSDGDITRRTLDGVADSRLRYVRSARKGKGGAMNEGIALARSPIIVFTDDDCEAPPQWVRGMVDMLARFPAAAAVFSSVTAAPHDVKAGYIPTFQCRGTTVISSVASIIVKGRGIGAAMAWQRDALLDIGGVDEFLGPGAYFRSCDDYDLEIRALLAGWPVIQSGDLYVTHYGFRRHDQGASHAKSSWTGIGAALGKLVRVGTPSVALLAVWEFLAHALLPPAIDLLHFRRPRGLSRITSFLGGFRRAFDIDVDRSSLTFRTDRPQNSGLQVSLCGDARDDDRVAVPSSHPGLLGRSASGLCAVPARSCDAHPGAQSRTVTNRGAMKRLSAWRHRIAGRVRSI